MVYLTVDEAAEYSGYSSHWIKILLRNNKIKSIKVKRRYQIDKVSLDTYIQEHQSDLSKWYKVRLTPKQYAKHVPILEADDIFVEPYTVYKPAKKRKEING